MRPEILTQEIQVKSLPIWSSSNEDVQFSEQVVSNFRIENTFIKTVSIKNSGAAFEISSLVLHIPKHILAEAEEMDHHKTSSWLLFLEKNPVYKSLKVAAPLEVIIATDPKLKPILKVSVDSRQGDIISVSFNKKGNLISAIRMGSNLTEMAEVPALAFPKGPKKSDLTAILLNRIVQPFGLATPFLEVVSESPNKITGFQSLEYATTDDRFDQVQAFYFSQEILKWFKEKISLQGTVKLSIVTNLGYPEKTNAAFYFQNQIRLGAGDDITFSKIPWDPTIVMHETSHAVIDVLSHLPFQGEGGSINEGYADFFTTYYLNSPFLADSSYQKADYKRTVDQALTLAQKNGGLYHDSAIVSGFFWSLKKLISPEKTLTLAVHVLNRLGPQSNFKDFALNLNEQSRQLLNKDDFKKVSLLIKERELL